MSNALPMLLVGGALGYLLTRSLPNTSDRRINKKLGRLKVLAMSNEARLQAVADSIDSFKIDAQASLDNLAGDVQRLTEAVQAGQTSEETVARLESLSAGLGTFKDAIAALASATPEPATEDPGPVDPPPTEDPGGELGN
jgi:TolA-binding protein